MIIGLTSRSILDLQISVFSTRSHRIHAVDSSGDGGWSTTAVHGDEPDEMGRLGKCTLFTESRQHRVDRYRPLKINYCESSRRSNINIVRETHLRRHRQNPSSLCLLHHFEPSTIAKTSGCSKKYPQRFTNHLHVRDHRLIPDSALLQRPAKAAMRWVSRGKHLRDLYGVKSILRSIRLNS